MATHEYSILIQTDVAPQEISRRVERGRGVPLENPVEEQPLAAAARRSGQSIAPRFAPPAHRSN